MKRNSLMEECRGFITQEIKDNIDFNIDIVNRIFDILEERSMTQREFALLLGKNEAEISRWMQGTHNFTMKTIKKIENRLDAHILEVIKNTDFSPINIVDKVLILSVPNGKKTYLGHNSQDISHFETKCLTLCLA